VGIATREFRDDVIPPLPPEFSEEIDPQAWQAYWEGRDHAPFPGRFVLDNLIRTFITATFISIVAGIILSRNLSAPLSNLADAARSIGRRDLSQRVKVHGSQEIKEFAQAFNEMVDDLQQAETLRQSLLADVAHELRTPISVIQGNLQAILDDVYELDKSEIAQLYDQTRQLTRLVDDLRELAQAEAGQLLLESIPVDLGTLIVDVASIYEPLAENQGIELQTEISEGLPLILGDRARLMQCLQNLLNNAFRHTPEGGVVALTLREESGALEIRVTDTGTGIPVEHLPFVFDRFYRVDPARARETGGTGLGLAITRAIIENHGGTISAKSMGEGQGSEFTMTFPVAK
jgi:two-component system OmpR family sensor kinase/two-component system sensor histidine kinase BaeS